MRAASLLVLFLLARSAALVGHHIEWSWWSPVAYFWQDAAVLLVFAAIDGAIGRRRVAAWCVYAAVATYVAVSIPVTRVLSTPLTWPMLRAARGALSDSIWLYATGSNVLWMCGSLLVSALAPFGLSRAPQALLRALPVGLVLCVALGPSAIRRVDTRGLERNAWTAIAAGALPRLRSTVQSRESPGWNAAGFGGEPSADLSNLRSIAAGRNIVLVSLESTAAQYLGVYGANPDVMPNVSNLARTGVVFENAYAVYPESIKGLFSVLCSTYPVFDGATEIYASVPCESLARHLSAGGYRTALFHSGRFGYLGMDAVVRGRGYDVLADAGDIGGHHESSFGVDEAATVSRILTWIDARSAQEPFFVTYLPIAGHHPYETVLPGPFAERTEFDRYRNALHEADEALGTLMRGLEVRGRALNTLWVVFGDHGEAFGQHEGNFGHTFFLYDENVHVPFLVAAPGLIPRHIRSRAVVSLIDVAPTVIDLAGLQTPAGYQGQSVLDSTPRMALFFADYSLGLLGLRDGALKFIYEVESGRSKLFDLDADPQERHDQSEGAGERARWYQENLVRWAMSQRERLAAH